MKMNSLSGFTSSWETGWNYFFFSFPFPIPFIRCRYWVYIALLAIKSSRQFFLVDLLKFFYSQKIWNIFLIIRKCAFTTSSLITLNDFFYSFFNNSWMSFVFYLPQFCFFSTEMSNDKKIIFHNQMNRSGIFHYLSYLYWS